MRRLAQRFILRIKKVLDRSQIGKGPVGIIDVGSFGGLQQPWCDHKEKVRYLLNFEPNDQPMRWRHMCTYNTALWKEEIELPFYIYKGFNATGSSLFEQNFEYVDSHWSELKHKGPKHLAETWHDRSQLVRATTLKCKKLDDVISVEGLEDQLHFLKIDAQGAEGQILLGARGFLSESCVGLQLELFKTPLYKGIMLRPEVTSFLEDLGFFLVLEMPPHGTFDSQNDCIFLHKERGPDEIRQVIQNVYNIK
jgi:FkbM family methyltransferase